MRVVVVGAEDLSEESARLFGAFIEGQPEWPLLFFEFWAYAVRDPRLREEFRRGRRAMHGAIAEAIEDRARAYQIDLPVPADQLALGLSALMNGLAFERVADPPRVPDELFGFLVSRFLLGVLSSP